MHISFLDPATHIPDILFGLQAASIYLCPVFQNKKRYYRTYLRRHLGFLSIRLLWRLVFQ
ncbi:hypothetical protein DHB64_01700 [Antarcticibacterium sp. W02-3]|nr:hypothetical protein [Antarcticibacterium sp. W02-3]